MVRGKKYELDLDAIEDATRTPVVSILHHDETMLKSLAETTPAAFLAPNSDISIEYKKLAAALIGERYKDPRILAKIKKLFSKGLSKEEINRAIVMESHY